LDGVLLFCHNIQFLGFPMGLFDPDPSVGLAKNAFVFNPQLN
jgi:hypothetical protein